MSWGIDTRCPSCIHKAGCPDRTALYAALSPLTNKLNIEEPFLSGPGDGTLIIACQDFAVAPRD